MATQKIRLAPRWMIFLLDLCCGAFAMALAYLLRFNFIIEEVAEFPLLKIFAITLSVNACLIIALKTYAGVIRYTSIEDLGRILTVNIFICSILLTIEQIHSTTSEHTLFPISVILIYFICSNFFLLLYRLIVRKLYQQLFAVRRKSVKAILYSAGYEGLLAKKMISENQRSDIKIISILEDSEKMIGKILENTSVIRANKANLERLKRDGGELLIIADPFIKKTRLNELVDICLEVGIKVQQVPSSEKWINNKLAVEQLKDINIEQLLEREVINIQNDKVGKDIYGKKILVTGAAGSIGSEIVRQRLQFNPAIVIACDIADTPRGEVR